jgi:hypothetical protein
MIQNKTNNYIKKLGPNLKEQKLKNDKIKKYL